MNIKLVVAIVASAALILAAFLFMSWVENKTSFGKGKASGRGASARAKGKERDKKHMRMQLSTQDLFPAADIRGPVLIQKDGCAIAYVKVRCVNSALLSTEEMIRQTEAVAIAISGNVEGFKIIHIQRPVDATELIESYEAKRCEYQQQASQLNDQVKADARRKDELSKKIAQLGYLQRLAQFEVSKNSHMRSEVYVVLPVRRSVNNEEAAYQRARKFCEHLRNVGFSGRILFCEEIVSFLLAFSGDYRTASERTNPNMAGTLVEGIHHLIDKEELDELASA